MLGEPERAAVVAQVHDRPAVDPQLERAPLGFEGLGNGALAEGEAPFEVEAAHAQAREISSEVCRASSRSKLPPSGCISSLARIQP